jgi:hypothetical protein
MNSPAPAKTDSTGPLSVFLITHPRLTAAVHLLRQPKSLNEGSATIANRSSIEESRRWMSRMVTPLAPRPEVEE